jgi:WD40 repeat protein
MANLLHFFAAGSGIRSLAVAGNGLVITDFWVGKIAVWDIPNRRKLRSFPSRHELLLSLAIIQDGRKTISNGLQRLRVWDLETGSLSREIDTLADDVNVLVFGPKGICFSGHKYGGILLWVIETTSSPS